MLKVTVSHDRTRPLSNNSGHCLETHTGSHLEVDETDSPDNTVISHSTTANSSTVFHDSTRSLTTNLGHCLEYDAGFQLQPTHLFWLGIPVVRIHYLCIKLRY